jgi:hypothetical protein
MCKGGYSFSDFENYRLRVPSQATLGSWLSKYPEFARQYQLACHVRAEGLIDEIYNVIDELNSVSDGEGIQAARVKIDAFKWLASKFYPRMYGKSIQVEAKVATTEPQYDYSVLNNAELSELSRLLKKAEIVQQ